MLCHCAPPAAQLQLCCPAPVVCSACTLPACEAEFVSVCSCCTGEATCTGEAPLVLCMLCHGVSHVTQMQVRCLVSVMSASRVLPACEVRCMIVCSSGSSRAVRAAAGVSSPVVGARVLSAAASIRCCWYPPSRMRTTARPPLFSTHRSARHSFHRWSAPVVRESQAAVTSFWSSLRTSASSRCGCASHQTN